MTAAMSYNICTHLMFDGNAEQAMNLYVSLFPDSAILKSSKYESGDNAGKLEQARFTLCGRNFICIDSPVKSDFSFSPAMSIFVELDDAADVDRVFGALSEDGELLMPLDNYGFSTRFGWTKERFGVSWQIVPEARPRRAGSRPP